MITQGATASPSAVPRRMNGLKLSKVPTEASVTVPPFGAFGLT